MTGLGWDWKSPIWCVCTIYMGKEGGSRMILCYVLGTYYCMSCMYVICISKKLPRLYEAHNWVKHIDINDGYLPKVIMNPPTKIYIHLSPTLRLVDRLYSPIIRGFFPSKISGCICIVCILITHPSPICIYVINPLDSIHSGAIQISYILPTNLGCDRATRYPYWLCQNFYMRYQRTGIEMGFG